MARTKFTLTSNVSNSYPTLNPALLLAPEPPKHGRFLLSSTVFHGALIALTALIQIQTPERETIEIDLTDTPTPIVQPAALKGEPEAPGTREPIEVPAAKPAPVAKIASAPKPAKAAAVQPVMNAALDTSALEDALESAEAAAASEPTFEAAELENDFDDIQNASAEEALASKELFDARAESLAEESDITAQKLKEENLQAANAQKAAAARANRQALVKELAAGRAEERAANERAAAQAKALADAQAAAEQKAALAAASARQGAANGGETGSARGTVRALSDLKQVPGNERPRYTVDDRMAGRQGDVTVLAYVSKSGTIAQVRMPQSSGHRSLDEKTLQAIKTWKFYPGQEGWVEIPFRWDLKGGPQERPTQLRRKVSQF